MPRTITVLVAPMVAAACVAAQQASGPQPKAGSLRSDHKTSTSASTAKRPNARIGNSIVQVLDCLIAAGAAKGKGEFETTEEFDSRQRALAAQFSDLAFLVPKDSTFDATLFAYDADHGEMQVHLRALPEYFHSNNDDLTEVKAIELASSATQTGSSYRTGAYGRRVRVDTVSEYGITISPDSPIRFDLNEPYINNLLASTETYAFPLSVIQARSMKPFLRAVIVGRIDGGRVHQESDTDPHLGDYSYDLTRNRFYIQFSVEEIRVVDVRNGATITAIRPTQTGR